MLKPFQLMPMKAWDTRYGDPPCVLTKVDDPVPFIQHGRLVGSQIEKSKVLPEPRLEPGTFGS